MKIFKSIQCIVIQISIFSGTILRSLRLLYTWLFVQYCNFLLNIQQISYNFYIDTFSWQLYLITVYGGYKMSYITHTYTIRLHIHTYFWEYNLGRFHIHIINIIKLYFIYFRLCNFIYSTFTVNAQKCVLHETFQNFIDISLQWDTTVVKTYVKITRYLPQT